MEGSRQPERIALVHDFLVDVRGAERVFLLMCDIWPEADVFTAVYDPVGTEHRFAHRNVQATYLNRVRPDSRTFRALLPFYPGAMESLDLSGYDLVVSSSSAWAHGVICDPKAVHVCYCHNPFRYAWNDRDRTLAEWPEPVSRALLRGTFRRWRQWDWIAAQRVDRYLTNSRVTKDRINAYYGRDAKVIHPPVEVDRFAPAPLGDHYLVLSELMPHKRIESAVHAFNRLGKKLIVAGDGPDARHLRRIAGPTVKLAGRVSDAEAERLLASCQALVVTAAEEFGIVAVEAQAAGRPVIARDSGGAMETVIEGETGTFWHGGAAELAEAVERFDAASVDSAACVTNAARFGAERFREELPREVLRAVREARAGEREVSALRARAARRGLASRARR